ncbi:hypothetical protein D3C81_436500 [compost metagenome]
MILKPIQSKNVQFTNSEGEQESICSICGSIELDIARNSLPLNIIYNGWKFVQNKPGAQNIYASTNVSEYLDLILFDEVKNTYWCSNCASLSFARIYASVIKNKNINIGFSTLSGESNISSIELNMLKDFELNLSSNSSKFFVYGTTTSEYNLTKSSTTNAIISNTNGRIGSLSFNQSTKKLTVSFDNKTKIISNSIISFVISLNLEDVLLTTNGIMDYDIFNAKINFNDGTDQKYTGCYIANFNDK